ncbi:MAG: DUF5050 domain-containing protein [Deltaproteobacteria bacterium]|nr:DUF5050 domain-containing protein [Deltaproteobacteria bacterium]
MGKLVCDSSACYFFEYSGTLTTGNICRCDLVTGVRNCFLQDICIPMKMSITASALYYAPSTSCGRSIRSCLLSDTSGTCTPTTLATADFSSFDNGIPNDGTYLYFGDGTDSVDRVLIADGSISTVCQPTGTTNPTNMTIDSSNAYFLYKINDSFVPTALAKCPLGSGTAVTELVTVSNPVIRFVSDGSYLYYVDGGSSYSGIGTDWDLKRVAVSGGSATPLLSDMALKSGLMGIAVSGDYLYISNSSSSGTAASLLKVKKDGSSFETLADMGNISDIFILGDKVYISGSTSSASGIFSVTK